MRDSQVLFTEGQVGSMPPTSKKLKGHVGFGPVRPFICQSVRP